MSLSVQPIQFFGTSPDRDGALISSEGYLVAVCLCLSHIHDDQEGRWFVEWGSNPDFADGQVFGTLEMAVGWLERQMALPN